MKNPIKVVYLFWSWSESVSWTWETRSVWFMNGFQMVLIKRLIRHAKQFIHKLDWSGSCVQLNMARAVLDLTAQDLHQSDSWTNHSVLHLILEVVTIHELLLNTRKTYMKTFLFHWRKAVWNGMRMKINVMFWVNYSFNGIREVHLI